jgi:hypothetical protein
VTGNPYVVVADPWSAPPRPRTSLVVPLVLIVAPLPLAVLFLVIGLLGPLFWVYLSIGVSVLWLPLLVVGVVMLVRRQRR